MAASDGEIARLDRPLADVQRDMAELMALKQQSVQPDSSVDLAPPPASTSRGGGDDDAA